MEIKQWHIDPSKMTMKVFLGLVRVIVGFIVMTILSGVAVSYITELEAHSKALGYSSLATDTIRAGLSVLSALVEAIMLYCFVVWRFPFRKRRLIE